jgi:uncharacterized protein (TIGR00730 family)
LASSTGNRVVSLERAAAHRSCELRGEQATDRALALNMPKNVCVFCGSSAGRDSEFARAARRVGVALVRHGLGLVYGGGRVGLMGILADAVLACGGHATGVIPEPLATKEIAHDGLTELHVVADMHQRKALMARGAGAFLTLPGGIGTLEEFFETLSWAGLGLHQKPLGILNVNGYFDPLLALLDHGVAAGFVPARSLDLLVVSADPDAIIADLAARTPVGTPWQAIDVAGS